MHPLVCSLLAFSLTVYPVIAVQHNLSGRSGNIKSENYPRTYPDYLDDTWNIKVGSGMRIFLNFSDFDLESSFDEDLGGPCVYDFLEIKEEGKVVKRYCGDPDKHPLDAPHPQSYIETCGNSLSLRFVSDFSNVAPFPKGFSAYYEEIGATCYYIPPPENGVLVEKEEIPYGLGTVLQFKCNDGYQMEGRDRLICAGSGDWTDPPPVCVGSYCPSVDPPEHGSMEKSANDGPLNKIGTVLRFSCKEGFRIVGKSEITCQKDRSWSEKAPFCHVTTCQKDERIIREKRRCRKSCEDDAECGERRKKCLCDGWCGKSCFNPEAECEEELRDPENGIAVVKGRKYGDVMTYECHEKYTLSGYRRRTCGSDRKWSGKMPKCVSHDTCGQAGDVGDSTGRVVYGKDALPGAWPWQAVILRIDQQDLGQSNYENKVHGGGSVINNRWILSAAHLFNDSTQVIPKEEVLIFLGVTELPQPESHFPEHVHIHKAKYIYQMSGYDKRSLDGDVLLMRIGNRLRKVGDLYKEDVNGDFIEYGKYIRPVCLPCLKKKKNNRMEYDSRECGRWVERLAGHTEDGKNIGMVTGFGIAEEGHTPTNLQQGSIKVQTDDKCRNYVRGEGVKRRYIKFTEQMICAKSANDSLPTDACSGDSGGPFVREFERGGIFSYYQIGIVSWGIDCGYMGFYTSVTSVMSWVAETIKRAGG